MNLPNADQAQVDRKKITEYLLCTSHPDGSNKALFFSQYVRTVWIIEKQSTTPRLITAHPK